MKNILIIAKEDSTLSQMMYGWMKYYAGKAGNVYSAGTKEGKVNMFAASAMMDAVIDITQNSANLIEEYKELEADFIIYVEEKLETELSLKAKEKSLTVTYTDPVNDDSTEEEKVEAYKKIRDQMEEFVFDFVNEHVKPLIPPEMMGLK